MNKDKKNKPDNILISDTGIIEAQKREYAAKSFIGICHSLSLILIILGIMAVINGYF